MTLGECDNAELKIIAKDDISGRQTRGSVQLVVARERVRASKRERQTNRQIDR